MSALRRFASFGLIFALVAAVAVTVYQAWRLNDRLAERRTVAALLANQDISPPTTAGAETLFARGYYLLIRDRIDEAQGYAQPIVDKRDPALAARFFYDLGNARLRRAIARVEASKVDDAIPEIRLAKDAYRTALIANPDLWDARYNLDVAIRLVRDFPEIERDEEAKGRPKKLWTDLPGLPRGLP